MKLNIRSTHRPALVTTPNRSKTLIVGGTITHVNGEKWDHPYVAILPGDAITLDDIEWEDAWGEITPSEQPTERYTVRGSTGTQYTVTRVGQMEYTCTCPHYTYRKQVCKHIKEVW